MMAEQTKFDWRKTAEKVFQVLGEIAIFGLIAYLENNGLYLVLVPVLHGIIDLMRHTEQKSI